MHLRAVLFCGLIILRNYINSASMKETLRFTPSLKTNVNLASKDDTGNWTAKLGDMQVNIEHTHDQTPRKIPGSWVMTVERTKYDQESEGKGYEPEFPYTGTKPEIEEKYYNKVMSTTLKTHIFPEPTEIIYSKTEGHIAKPIGLHTTEKIPVTIEPTERIDFKTEGSYGKPVHTTEKTPIVIDKYYGSGEEGSGEEGSGEEGSGEEGYGEEGSGEEGFGEKWSGEEGRVEEGPVEQESAEEGSHNEISHKHPQTPSKDDYFYFGDEDYK